MRDSAKFRPCPNRPNHWIEVEVVPEETVAHRVNATRREPARDPQSGAVLIGQYVDRPFAKTEYEVKPAYEVPTGFEIIGRPGQSLEDAILAFEAGNPDEAAEFDVVTMMMGDGSGEG